MLIMLIIIIINNEFIDCFVLNNLILIIMVFD